MMERRTIYLDIILMTIIWNHEISNQFIETPKILDGSGSIPNHYEWIAHVTNHLLSWIIRTQRAKYI